MRELIRTPATPVWLGLVVATVLTYALGAEDLLGSGARQAATALVLAIAFVKVCFVGLYFMELRHAPLFLRGLFLTWATVFCVATITIYLAS